MNSSTFRFFRGFFILALLAHTSSDSFGLRAKVEPSSVAQTDARRTDVKISGLLGNQGELFTDITVTNPTCASHVEDAAVVSGSAAAKAAVAKMGYHGAAVASTGPGALFGVRGVPGTKQISLRLFKVGTLRT